MPCDTFVVASDSEGTEIPETCAEYSAAFHHQRIVAIVEDYLRLRFGLHNPP